MLLFLLGLFAIYDSLSVQALPGQRWIYAVVLAYLLIAILPFAGKARIPRRLRGYLIVWTALAMLYVVPVATQLHVYPMYVLGDFTSVMMPAVMWLYGYTYPQIFTAKRSLTVMGVLLGVAAILSYAMSGGAGDPTVRHDAPRSLLLALIWVRFIGARSTKETVYAFVALVAVLLIAFVSGFRASVVLWLVAGVVMLVIRVWPKEKSQKSRLRVLPLLVLTIVMVGVGWGKGEHIVQELESSRFRLILRGEYDASLLSRFDEARDALDTAAANWPIVQHLYGYGHGASYLPFLSYVERNVTREGVVHHIHVGSVLVFFRYGLLGVLVYVSLVVLVLRRTLMLCRHGTPEILSGPRATFTLAMFIYLLQFQVFNCLVEPTFSYTLGGFLFFENIGKRERGGARGSYLQRVTKGRGATADLRARV